MHPTIKPRLRAYFGPIQDLPITVKSKVYKGLEVEGYKYMKINVEKLEENSVHSGKRGPYTVNGHDWPYQFLAHCFHVMVRDYQVTETSLKTLEEKKTKLESIFNSALQAEFDIPFHAFCEEALEILRVHTVPTDASDGSNSTPTDDYVKSLSNSIYERWFTRIEKKITYIGSEKHPQEPD